MTVLVLWFAPQWAWPFLLAGVLLAQAAMATSSPAVRARPAAPVRRLDRAVAPSGSWPSCPPPTEVELLVLLYGPPGPALIEGHGRPPVPVVPVGWQQALDKARLTDLPAHARSVAAQRRWDAPSPATQPTEAVSA